jgi:hypothetical protein
VLGWFHWLVIEHPLACGLVLLGAIISDLVHTITDRLSTRIKRLM